MAEAFRVPPLSKKHLDYIFIFRSLKSASFLIREGNLLLPLPSLFPITVAAADEMAVQHWGLSFGQLFLMKHCRERDNCAVPCCVCNICMGTIVLSVSDMTNSLFLAFFHSFFWPVEHSNQSNYNG